VKHAWAAQITKKYLLECDAVKSGKTGRLGLLFQTEEGKEILLGN
jgi:hypothetical protein